MKPAVEKRLKEICEGLQNANPGLFFWADEWGVHLRDYAAGRDFTLYATVINADTIVDCNNGGRYLSFPIPQEGPVEAPPFNIGDVVKDKETGKLYRVSDVTLTDERRWGSKPCWRAKGVDPENEWHWREQSELYWTKVA